LLICLQKRAALLALALTGFLGRENGTDGLVEHLYKTLLGGSRAFKVLDCADLDGLCLAIFLSDGTLVLLAEPLDGVLIAAKINLCTDKNHGGSGAVMGDLRSPLCGDVIKGRGTDDAEANEEHIGLGVGKWSETIVILLTCGIPKTQVHCLTVDDEVCAVVIKHCGDVLAGERVCCETDQKASLTDCTITDCNTLDCLHFL